MNNISEKPDEDFQSNDNEKNISSKGENELYNELIKKRNFYSILSTSLFFLKGIVGKIVPLKC